MRTLLALLLAGAAAPAFAQHSDHAAPPAADASCTAEHAAMGHCTLPAPAPQPADPHAGHDMPSDPHAGHDMSAATATPPVAPPPAEALSGPEHAADSYWGEAAMDHGRAVLLREHGGMTVRKLLVDRLETQFRDGRDGYVLDAEAWYGGDIDKIWLKAEVEGDFGRTTEHAEVQALWSHAIDPWFDLQAGVRLDLKPETRTHLVLGVQGLAPYWIEVDAAAFLSDRGDVTVRAEAEHDVRITQDLILQPRAELDLALQDIERDGIGSGLSTAGLGLRLRYQIAPTFAPYVGVQHERAFGGTRRFRRAEGEDLGGWSLLAGIRAWF